MSRRRINLGVTSQNVEFCKLTSPREIGSTFDGGPVERSTALVAAEVCPWCQLAGGQSALVVASLRMHIENGAWACVLRELTALDDTAVAMRHVAAPPPGKSSESDPQSDDVAPGGGLLSSGPTPSASLVLSVEDWGRIARALRADVLDLGLSGDDGERAGVESLLATLQATLPWPV